MTGRLKQLRSRLADEGLKAAVISNPVNIAYLSGFSGTAGILLVTGSDCFLLTDFRYIEQAQAQAKGCAVVSGGAGLYKKAAELLGQAGIDTVLVEGDHLTVEAHRGVQAAMESIAVTSAPSLVSGLRRIKSVEEQKAIEAAVALTDQAYSHILGQVRAGARERDLALELEFFMRKHGASGVSFDIIIASGERSALPHGVAGDRLLAEGDAVVLDFGCVLDGYCSDMTRTLFIGYASVRQREVYEAVLAAQQAALAQLRAGMSGREADALARDVLASYGLAEQFGHGLGHGLGRDIHEGPRLSPISEDVLEAGMVVTVEPGAYLSGEFGVRIEDVVVVEEHGVRNLTQSAKDLRYI